MNIVIDTSAVIAVIVAEPERDAIIAATSGHTLIGPGSIPSIEADISTQEVVTLVRQQRGRIREWRQRAQ